MPLSMRTRKAMRWRLVLCLMAAAAPGLALVCLLLPPDAPARWIGFGIAFGTGIGWMIAERALLAPFAALGWGRELARPCAGAAQTEALYRMLADHATDQIAHLDEDFRRTYVSPYCREMLGYEPEELVGSNSRDTVHPDDWAIVEAELYSLRDGAASARASYRLRRKDGTYVWVETAGRRLAPGEGYVIVTRDISERKALETRLETLNRQLAADARQDQLTGVANRRRFTELFQFTHRQALRLAAPMAVVMLDIDRFKSFNDRYGHPAGDACLRIVAEAMQQALGMDGTLARLGGEEFAVLLPLTDEAAALPVARRLLRAVRDLALVHEGSPGSIVTVSAGVAHMLPSLQPGDPERLMELADRALYDAKRGGRDAVCCASGSHERCHEVLAPPPGLAAAAGISSAA
jgi:diguanylate cyclase (GGDEF)-like protein/PAS domain S-box-containing protein